MTVQMTMEEYMRMKLAEDKLRGIEGVVTTINKTDNSNEACRMIQDMLISLGITCIKRSNYV